jgi:hypothetical protein
MSDRMLTVKELRVCIWMNLSKSDCMWCIHYMAFDESSASFRQGPVTFRSLLECASLVTAVARVFLLVSSGTWWQKPCLEACDKKKNQGNALLTIRTSFKNWADKMMVDSLPRVFLWCPKMVSTNSNLHVELSLFIPNRCHAGCHLFGDPQI